jgi:hypothetical protein
MFLHLKDVLWIIEKICLLDMTKDLLDMCNLQTNFIFTSINNLSTSYYILQVHQYKWYIQYCLVIVRYKLFFE